MRRDMPRGRRRRLRPEENGLAPLNAPAFDAEAIANILSRRGVGFEITVLTDDSAKDKATFNAALDKFLERVRPGDEVVFYFSGHGVGLDEKGNYYMLLDAKDQDSTSARSARSRAARANSTARTRRTSVTPST